MKQTWFKLLGAVLVMLPSFVSAQYDITFTADNYENDTLLIGFYYGDRQLVQDTLYASDNGTFALKGADTLDAGMYLALTKPDNNFVQFFVPNGDQEFEVKFDAEDLENLEIKGSADNEAFLKYITFLGDMREKVEPLRLKKKELEEAGKAVDPAIDDQIDAMDKEVEDKQRYFVESNPGTMTANLLLANQDVSVPDFDDVAEADRPMAQYLYYKEHFFDNIDWDFDGMVRMPYFNNKLTTYFDKLVAQSPDSIIKEADIILANLANNEDTYRYTLSNLLSKYARMKYIGHDAIYVHLVDNYYSDGKASWTDKETIAKLSKNADDLRPVLIGKQFPNIQTYKQDQTPVKLHDVEAAYTVVMFWKYDCGHCKKAMPFVVDFYNEYKDKNVKVITICTNPGEKSKKCWEFIEEKNMGDFINTGDQYQRYRKEVTVRSTPKIFVLNKDKTILIKDIPGKDLSKIVSEIIKEDGAQSK